MFSLKGKIKWPMIGFNITLVRKPKMFLVATYLPSTIFVVISWMSFVIPPEVYPGRIGLLLTTLLVLINIFMGIMESTPTGVETVNQIQLWLVICIVFVFLTVVIY